MGLEAAEKIISFIVTLFLFCIAGLAITVTAIGYFLLNWTLVETVLILVGLVIAMIILGGIALNVITHMLRSDAGKKAQLTEEEFVLKNSLVVAILLEVFQTGHDS